MRVTFVTLLYTVVSTCALTTWISDGRGIYRFTDFLDRTAESPQVTRRLVPMIVAGIGQLCPDGFREAGLAFFRDVRTTGGYLLTELGVPPDLWIEGVVCLTLELASLVGSLLLLRVLAGLTIEGCRPMWRDVAPLLSIPVLGSLYFSGPHYIYDRASLFFAAAFLAALVSKRYVLMAALVFPAALNKETILFLVVPSFIYLWRRLPRRGFLLLAAATAATFLLGRAVAVDFRIPRPDYVIAYTNIGYNLDNLAKASWAVASPAYFLLVIAFVMMARHWTQRHEILQLHAYSFILFALSFMVGGYWFESRVFLELVPGGFLLLFQALMWLPGPPNPHAPDPTRAMVDMTIPVVLGSIILMVFLVIALSAGFDRDLPSVGGGPLKLTTDGSMELVPEGTVWNHASCSVIGRDGAIVVLTRSPSGNTVTIAVDGNDRYLVEGRSGNGTRISSQVIGPDPGKRPGIAHYEVSSVFQSGETIQSLVVSPVDGDNKYSLCDVHFD